MVWYWSELAGIYQYMIGTRGQLEPIWISQL